MSSLVLGFQEIERTQLYLVGGKGFNLGELSKIEGIRVPEGFCVSTAGYQKAIGQNETYHALLDRLTMLKVKERDQIGEISRKIPRLVMNLALQFVLVRLLKIYHMPLLLANKTPI
ncbi:phosphoenolpyruvate synthase/pyruvate phosphate dikinase [Paenibacillus wynnii]|nr:phosphoenolpyruvate synthase/pyruvate phosphate dikinase [Paenibacillus wynnii]